MNSEKKKQYFLLFLIPANILLYFAMTFRLGPSSFFHSISTWLFSGHHLTPDQPDINGLLWGLFKRIFEIYAYSYLASSYLFLLPAILLFAVGFYGLFGEKRILKSFFENKRNEKIFIGAMMILCAILVAWAHFCIIGDNPVICDEFSYVFQAEILSHGKLFVDSPTFPEFFTFEHMINDGKNYSKYTIGWPLILALGYLVGMRFLPGILCTVFSLLLLYLIGRRLYGSSGGALAVFLAVSSPFFFLLGGTYFAHSASGLFALIFIYGLVEMFERKGWIYPVIAGFGAGYLFLVRPADGALIFAGMVPFVIYCLYKSSNRKSDLKKIFLTLITIGFWGGILLLVNWIQNGSPFLLAFSKYSPWEKWGFGTREHTLIKGLWNVGFEFMRNVFWTVPFITFFGVLSVFRKDLRVPLLLVAPFLFKLFFIGYYGIGISEMGTRFYYPAFIIMLIPAAGGLLWFGDFLKSRKMPGWNLFLPSFVFIIVIFMFISVYMPMFPKIRHQFNEMSEVIRNIEYPQGLKTPALVFMKDNTDKQNVLFIRNHYPVDGQQVVKVLYLTPAENKELIKKFPKRNLYTAIQKQHHGDRKIISGLENGENGMNYFYAAMNYWYGVEDLDRAKKEFKRALELAPGNPLILLNYGLFCKEIKEYDNAIKAFKPLLKNPEYQEEAIYNTGTALGSLGRYEEAIKMLKNINGYDKEGNYWEVKGKGWIENYQKKLKK